MNDKVEPRKTTDFEEILDMMASLHRSKSQDYSGVTDPYANMRECEKMGIPAWKGSLVRLTDKMSRAMAFANKGSVNHEGIEDTFIDIANYAVITLVLYRQYKPAGYAPRSKYPHASEEGE